jgi:hypothetical protein
VYPVVKGVKTLANVGDWASKGAARSRAIGRE